MKILKHANTSWTGPNPKSFYYLFEYHHMEDDAVDATLVYESVVITKTIKTKGGHELKQGDTYNAVWFQFDTEEFLFISWIDVSPYTQEVNPERSVFIPQKELAPFLHWNKDLTKPPRPSLSLVK